MNTGTQSVSDVFTANMARYQKQTHALQPELTAEAPVIPRPTVEKIIIKPAPASWEDLEQKLAGVINFLGVWARAKQLYEQGYGAELETLADICLATHREKHPYQMFAASISKARGNWDTITLNMVRATWEVRRNAVTVIEKLNLKSDSNRAILALAWRMKGTILRFLSLATEQGTGVKNPVAYFLAMTKRPKQPQSAAT